MRELATALAAILAEARAQVAAGREPNVAEFEVVFSGDAVTVMVTDRGRGFDQDAVPADRLGLRASVVDRVEAVGGHVQIWTTPGEGTSVVITAPARPIEPSESPAGGEAR